MANKLATTKLRLTRFIENMKDGDEIDFQIKHRHGCGQHIFVKKEEGAYDMFLGDVPTVYANHTSYYHDDDEDDDDEMLEINLPIKSAICQRFYIFRDVPKNIKSMIEVIAPLVCDEMALCNAVGGCWKVKPKKDMMLVYTDKENDPFHICPSCYVQLDALEVEADDECCVCKEKLEEKVCVDGCQKCKNKTCYTCYAKIFNYNTGFKCPCCRTMNKDRGETKVGMVLNKEEKN